MGGIIKESDERNRYIPERIPPAATRASQQVLVQTAETIARRSHEAVRPDQAREYTNAPTVRERNEGRNKINNLVRPREERALRSWADQNKLFLDSEAFDRRWTEQGQRGEAEHRLYFDQRRQLWFKCNNLSNYGNWMAYFQAIQLHNWLFPAAPLKLEGFVNEGAHLRPVISQPHIPAVRGATQLEVDEVMLHLGFQGIRMHDQRFARRKCAAHKRFGSSDNRSGAHHGRSLEAHSHQARPGWNRWNQEAFVEASHSATVLSRIGTNRPK